MMKFLLLIMLSLLTIISRAEGKPFCVSQYKTDDTTVLPQILGFSLNTFIGKPVDSLLTVLPSGYTKRDFMPVRIGYSCGVYQSYGIWANNTVTVQIYIDNHQYMTFPNRTKTTNWDMNLAKQETISFIKVIKNNNVCLFGCNNPDYDY